MRWGIGFAALSVFLLTTHAVRHALVGIAQSDGGLLGGDFINYWCGALLAASGRGPLAYDVGWFRAFEAVMVGPPGLRWYSYPPIAMLLSVPLALLSFIPALAVWVLTSIAACFLLLRRLVSWPTAVVAAIGAPAAYSDLLGGQNGHFTAALFAGGLMLLGRRPVAAGICFGFLTYKPHLGLLVPVALVAAGHWRAFSAAAVTFVLLALTSAAVVGTTTWIAYLDQMVVERAVLESEAGVWPFMVTVFSALRTFAVPLSFAYGAQLTSALFAFLAVGFVWRAPGPTDGKAALLVVATFLATPHAWGYDLVLLIFGAIWLGREGLRTGFLPWERISILALIVLPLFTELRNVILAPAVRAAAPLVLASVVSMPLEPIVLWLIALVLIRRCICAR